jgi:hypothetical protein
MPEQRIGVATTNGALCLLDTSFASRDSLLETTEQILMSACKGSLTFCDSVRIGSPGLVVRWHDCHIGDSDAWRQPGGE